VSGGFSLPIGIERSTEHGQTTSIAERERQGKKGLINTREHVIYNKGFSSLPKKTKKLIEEGFNPSS
jgi:hypothetical protein